MFEDTNRDITDEIDDKIDEYLQCTGCEPERLTLNANNLDDLTAILLNGDTSITYNGEEQTEFSTYRGLTIYLDHDLNEDESILID